MSVRDLTREQLDELKVAYVCEMVENPSYSELAESVNIPDEIIFNHYDFVRFVADDFIN